MNVTFDKDSSDFLVKLSAQSLFYFRQGLFETHSISVSSFGSHRIKAVSESDDFSHNGYPLAGQAGGVSGAVDSLVMTEDAWYDIAHLYYLT